MMGLGQNATKGIATFVVALLFGFGLNRLVPNWLYDYQMLVAGILIFCASIIVLVASARLASADDGFRFLATVFLYPLLFFAGAVLVFLIVSSTATWKWMFSNVQATSGITGAVIGALGTILAGWIAFHQGRRQTTRTLEQQTLLHNRQIAGGLRVTASSLSEHRDHLGQLIFLCGRVENFSGSVLDLHNDIRGYQAPEFVVPPPETQISDWRLAEACSTVTELTKRSKKDAETCRDKLTRAFTTKQQTDLENNSEDVTKQLQNIRESISKDMATLQLFEAFLLKNAVFIADSKVVNPNIHKLRLSFALEELDNHSVAREIFTRLTRNFPHETFVQPETNC